MHAYLATLCRDSGADAYRVGGVSDHVHIACSLPRTLTVSKLIETIKKNSSKWIKQQDHQCEKFQWQAGYGAFSVDPSKLDLLVKYIESQPEHHRVVSFKDEYRRFLKKFAVGYDERYVWD